MIAEGNELIDLISEIRSQYNCFDDADQKYYEALSMVLRMLRHLPSEQPCGDAISRQAAIDALMKRDKELRNINWYDKPFAEGECKGIDYALEIVNALPSAQPQREEDCDTCKHGYFGDRQCDNCRMRYPSHYEREEEHHA